VTDAAGYLAVDWYSGLVEVGDTAGQPAAWFKQVSLPWYLATEPSDSVFVFVGPEEDWVAVERPEGPYLDAGTPLFVEGAPGGSMELDRQTDNSYSASTFDPLALDPGELFEWEVPGGADVNGFSKQMPVPEQLVVSSPECLGFIISLDRSVPLQITWEAPLIRQDAHIVVLITAGSGEVFAAVEADLIDDGSATIGTEYLSQLPSDDVVIVIVRVHCGDVSLTRPAGKRAYFASISYGLAPCEDLLGE
jgi:hypothetical protein